MTTNMNRIDWILCLAWGLGHAILTALVGRTAVNAAVTYDQIRLAPGAPKANRWVGRCKACGADRKVDGVLATGWRKGHGCDQIVVAGTSAYLTACNGTDSSMLWVPCCSARAKLTRVYDSHRAGKPRHECNAKCLASTGPACECKCKGANHGAGH